MKNILVYGDSITWGFVPGTGNRHDKQARWPEVMANVLKMDLDIVTDGLCGRTTAYDDNTNVANRNGVKTLPTVLSSHSPLDLVIVMLGLNDLQPHIAGSPLAAVDGMKRLIEIIKIHEGVIQQAGKPNILIVSQPHISTTQNEIYQEYFDGMIEASKKLAPRFEQLAKENKCAFFDAAKTCQSSPLDGVHLDRENTIKLGKGLVPIVQEILA